MPTNHNNLDQTDWESLKRYYDHRCVACGKVEAEALQLTLDHVVPLSAGGTTTHDNIQPLCRRCNAAKGMKSSDHRPY